MRCRLACLLILSACGLRAANWIRVSSESIELFTDSGEGAARAVVNRLETLRGVFGESYRADLPAPLRVFVFASEGEYQKYRAGPNSAGFYRADQDRDFIVLYQQTALKRNASHEYLHMVMNHSATKLPSWLEEGVPEFYSTLSVNGTKMRIGEPIEAHRAVLATQPWLSAEDLALGSPSDGQIFYAESWGLVHMLSLSPDMKEGMPKFLRLLIEGRAQEEAFAAAFGMSMDDALEAVHFYIKHPKEITVPAPPASDPEKHESAQIGSLEVTLTLADLALHTEHPELARSLFLRAAKENPESPAAIAGLGSLALAEDRKEDARREFEKAIGMGYSNASVYFELAALRKDNALLEKAVSIDPNFAEAQFLLGVRATDSENFPAALEHLRRAVAIKPRKFTYWHALGYAQAKSGDRQGASESARRAAILASNGQEEQMAAALTLLAGEQAQAVREKRPDVITPPSWQNRKGDARVEGTLTKVDCDSDPVRLSIEQTGEQTGKSIDLRVENPAAVELVNTEGASTTLVCGKQSRPVAVEYLSASKEITRIEFKQAIIKR